MRKLRNVETVSVVIGALGSVSAEFHKWMGKLGITFNVEVTVGNCKNRDKSTGNVKMRVFC